MPRLDLLLLVLLLPASALAAGKGELSLTAGPGVTLATQGQARVGASLDARFLYGLSDAWSARVGFAGAWLPASGQVDATRMLASSCGLTVAADALKLVPFAEVGLAGADLRGGGRLPQQSLGGELAVGADYLVSRHFTLSLLARLDYFALRLAGTGDAHPLQVTFALHVGRVF